ncbi:S26 family signal peptidase [Inquilinus limosus]|uniref:S26 family signal peptidase n=1 Tax=Inquilinus limosus TaxID=171674 RepID=UPI003F1599F0
MRSPAAASRRRRGRFRPRHVLALGGAGLGLLGLAALGRPAPLVVYNASASAPIGFYWVRPAGVFRRGDLVLARTPEALRRLAAERGYVPSTVPLVKRIAALAGDTVCALGHVVAIDGRPVAAQRQADGRGRPLPAWTGCRMLAAGDVFLLMEDVPDSFDGRYFGVSPAVDVIGRLVPLWTG